MDGGMPKIIRRVEAVFGISTSPYQAGLRRRSLSLPFSERGSSELGPDWGSRRQIETRLLHYALREVHEGICGQHLGGRTLAYKILRQGYYWPVMQKDAASFTRRCDQCQKFYPLSHTPAIPLSILTSPIPFAMWGMDILGPFPMATGQRRFVIVAIDYFTKWTEAEPLATITEAKCEEFF
ncbi:hypothetical protein RJ639_044171 [Escallonia herrerae]|uniref:Integrase zinc-binding domain-containing protein n=1 Tax=Escallonia herrerae TaxID=1293975 RepID=A0AA88WAW4_9ASTE|nr:hypothetical protein RJ639_044171 [Escallonia herrerae]